MTLPPLLAQIRLFGVLVTALLVTQPAAFSQSMPSPTGRTPRLYWTQERQAIWGRMVRENHPWWQYLKEGADNTGTSNAPYAAGGQWAAAAYQFTGDRGYAAKAWDAIAPALRISPPAGGRNTTREDFISYVWMYDWLYPALSSAQRQQYIAFLNYWADLVLNKVSGVSWGTRTSDSDETIGHYFGLALLDLATAPDNPRAGSFLGSSWTDGGVRASNVGGLDSTGINNDTMRNAIRRFAEYARGGLWIESSAYNMGTLKLLFAGVEGVRTATGADHFPELTELYSEFARAALHSYTPDLKDSYQWGDDEHPHEFWLFHRLPFTLFLAGLTQGSSDIGPFVHKLAQELADLNGGRTVDIRFIPFYNPYAAASDWRSPSFRRDHYVSGMGQFYFRSGWGRQDSFFAAFMPTWPSVDHEVPYLGDAALYRKGEWILYHPIAYGGSAVNHNVARLAGLGAMYEFRRPVAAEAAANGSFAYFAGTTGGQFYWQDYWSPPPTFCHEYTRSLLYLPGAGNDALIIHDRMNLLDPRRLPSYDRYYPAERNPIEAAASLAELVFHSPLQPTISGGTARWQTAGGQHARIVSLSPAATLRAINEQAERGALDGYIHDSERHWQLRINPSGNARWTTFLTLVEGSAAVREDRSAVAVESLGHEAQGLLLARPNTDDALVLFNAQPGPDLPPPALRNGRSAYDPQVQDILFRAHRRQTGYAVSWTAATPRTELFLLDLEPGKLWYARLNGDSEQQLQVSTQGVARLSVTRTGSNTLVLREGGTAPDRVPPAAPRALQIFSSPG